MRALIRCVAQKSNRIWHRNKGNNKQSMFMPKDLHITHVILYAVSPELIHNCLLYEEHGSTQAFNEELLTRRTIDPVSDHLMDLVLSTTPQTSGTGGGLQSAAAGTSSQPSGAAEQHRRKDEHPVMVFATKRRSEPDWCRIEPLRYEEDLASAVVEWKAAEVPSSDVPDDRLERCKRNVGSA